MPATSEDIRLQMARLSAVASCCGRLPLLKLRRKTWPILGGKDKELETVKAFIGANTENFINALDLIDSEYGSMMNYLRGPLGLSEEDIRLLKEHYLQAVVDE